MTVHVATDTTTIAIVRQGAAIFFRTMPPDSDAALADAIYQSAMYHVDRLEGQALERVVVADRARRQDVLACVHRAFDARPDLRVDALALEGTVQFSDRIAVAPDVVAALTGSAGTLLAQA